MKRSDYITLAIMLLAGVALISYAQTELPDADFKNVTVQGSVPLTLGDGTDRDICENFNDGSLHDSICWDGDTNQFMIDSNGLSVIDNAPVLNLYDTDYSSTSAAAAFSASYGDPDADDSSFIVTALFANAPIGAWKITSSAAGNPVYAMGKANPFMQVGYTGVNGSQFGFLINAQGYYLDDDIYIDEASPGGMFLKDTGGNCYKCSLSTTQTYSNTNVTTDRAFDANATSIDELADVLGTLIADLDTINHVGTSTDNALVCTAATCPAVSP